MSGMTTCTFAGNPVGLWLHQIGHSSISCCQHGLRLLLRCSLVRPILVNTVVRLLDVMASIGHHNGALAGAVAVPAWRGVHPSKWSWSCASRATLVVPASQLGDDPIGQFAARTGLNFLLTCRLGHQSHKPTSDQVQVHMMSLLHRQAGDLRTGVAAHGVAGLPTCTSRKKLGCRKHVAHGSAMGSGVAMWHQHQQQALPALRALQAARSQRADHCKDLASDLAR